MSEHDPHTPVRLVTQPAWALAHAPVAATDEQAGGVVWLAEGPQLAYLPDTTRHARPKPATPAGPTTPDHPNPLTIHARHPSLGGGPPPRTPGGPPTLHPPAHRVRHETPMHDDDSTGTDQLTVGEPTGLLAALVIHDSYYCDQAVHHSKTVAGTAPPLASDPKAERPAAKAGHGCSTLKWPHRSTLIWPHLGRWRGGVLL